MLMSADVPAVSALRFCALAVSLAGSPTGGLFSGVGAPPLSARAEMIRAIPANAIAMRVSFRPGERFSAPSWVKLCRHHLRKSSTSRARGSSASAIEVPWPGVRCDCGDGLKSSGSVDSLVRARSRVFGARRDRAGCGSRDDELDMRGNLDGAFGPVLCTPSRKRRSNSSRLICGAGPNPETPI